jgi:uncharacterized cupin superfamily protein
MDEMTFELKQSPVPEFAWHTSPKLSETAQSRHLHFDMRQLDPDKVSYPYHFHRNAEEIFVILSGKAMLRTPDGCVELAQGDMVFFETGPSGAHQLFNHTQEKCRYIDIRTEAGIDVCEYPDSGKVNILPYQEIYETKDRVDYFKGEENVKDKWPAGS